MKMSKVLGTMLLVFAVYTLVGMIVDNGAFWRIYNYVTLAFSIVSGVILLNQK